MKKLGKNTFIVMIAGLMALRVICSASGQDLFHWEKNSGLRPVSGGHVREQTLSAPIFSSKLPKQPASQPIKQQGQDFTADYSSAHDTVWLRIVPKDAGYVAVVHNPLSTPVEVELLGIGLHSDVHVIPQLPVNATLQGHEQRVLARFFPAKKTTKTFALTLNVIPGPATSVQIHDGETVYQLPFRGVPIHISQQFHGKYSHNDAANAYALDFVMPEGTPILAARDGLIMEVQSDITRRNHFEDNAGNYVRILHADGTMALYAHLMPKKLGVAPGDRVLAGQLIGYSGQTGHTTGAHLHFVVQRNVAGRLVAIPFRMLTPQGELQFISSVPQTSSLQKL